MSYRKNPRITKNTGVKTCGTCHRPIPENAPRGLCPVCLYGLAERIDPEPDKLLTKTSG
jgi:hypothetical protein